MQMLIRQLKLVRFPLLAQSGRLMLFAAILLIAGLLSRYRIELDEGSGDEWQAWPIPKPRDGLPLRFVPLG